MNRYLKSTLLLPLLLQASISTAIEYNKNIQTGYIEGEDFKQTKANNLILPSNNLDRIIYPFNSHQLSFDSQQYFSNLSLYLSNLDKSHLDTLNINTLNIDSLKYSEIIHKGIIKSKNKNTTQHHSTFNFAGFETSPNKTYQSPNQKYNQTSELNNFTIYNNNKIDFVINPSIGITQHIDNNYQSQNYLIFIFSILLPIILASFIFNHITITNFAKNWKYGLFKFQRSTYNLIQLQSRRLLSIKTHIHYSLTQFFKHMLSLKNT